MQGVFEDSPEGFVARWRARSVAAELFAKTEGHPLIECRVGELVLQLFERTGPYLSQAGPARVIVNPTVERLEPSAFALTPGLEVAAISAISARGRVVEVDDRTVVVDVGWPLVVSCLEPLAEGVHPGVDVSFDSQAPVHGYVLSDAPHRRRDGRTSDDDI